MIKDKVELSANFKSQSIKAIASIIIFAIVYIIILLAALSLTSLCIYGGLALFAIYPGFITIALGLGLVSLGLLVLFFLLKFIFKTNKIDRSHLTQINQQDEPELYTIITQLVNEVGTPFPKKIYLSPEVNASVFYDSNFWSMLLPIRKNLIIGLGLVNSISKEEFKAILSHEFGHFSQKSMKVGSFVYNVNQIIFNMLYDNESYDKMIQNWANTSNYFTIFVVIAVKIVEGIQWILKMMYELVNKNYMSLSREMEFHADEIAANVTGYPPLNNSLLRMSLAEHSYNSVLAFYEGKIHNNIKSENIFIEQSYIMTFTANEDNISLNNSLPEVTLADLNKFNKSKLVIEDQWASHPSVEERIKKLEDTKLIETKGGFSLANNIFKDIETTQKELTAKMFDDVKYNTPPTKLPIGDFKKEFDSEYLKNTFAPIFNGYYDNKNPIHFEIETKQSNQNNPNLKTIFNDNIVNLNYEFLSLQNDIEIIRQISNKTLKIKSFDYDGNKFKRKESTPLLKRLDIELSKINDSIKENDINIYNFFLKEESLISSEQKLNRLYNRFFEFDKEYDIKMQVSAKLSEELDFINYITPQDQIRSNLRSIASNEKIFKQNIKEILEDKRYANEISIEIRDNFELYLSKTWQYFIGENYVDENLEILFGSLNNYGFLLSRGYFLHKKELLEYKDTLVKKNFN